MANLIQYIWENKSVTENQLYGRWQYGDGESSQGGARSELEAWRQLYFGVKIKRQQGHEIDSVKVVFGEPAPVTENSEKS